MSGWRDVPEPACLRDALRTRGGMPVPHAAAWTSEDHGYVAKPDPLLVERGSTRLCMFDAQGEPGEGHAKLAMLSPARQRESALLYRCQVCRTPLTTTGPPWDPPLWIVDLRSRQTTARDTVLDESGRQAITVNGQVRPLIYEPWLCEPCLLYSLQACKGLRAMRQRQALTVWRVREAILVPTLERPAEAPADGSPTPEMVVTYVKVAITDGQELHPYQVLRALRGSASTGSVVSVPASCGTVEGPDAT